MIQQFYDDYHHDYLNKNAFVMNLRLTKLNYFERYHVVFCAIQYE
jgi:hypothetical protein